MRERKDEIEATGTALVCIVQGTAEEAARFCGRHGLAESCVPDPWKVSYKAMGFPRVRWRDLASMWPAMMERRREATAAGCGASLAGTFSRKSDLFQLPGAALVEPGGRIAWLHRGRHPGDLPPASALVEVCRRHAS